MPKAPNRRKAADHEPDVVEGSEAEGFRCRYATKVSGDLSSYVQEHFEEVREKQEKLKA